MEQPIYLFPCPLWVNLQCSAIFSPVASRNYGCFIRLDTRVPPVIDPTAMPCLWALIRAKKQSMAATAWVIWLDKRVPPVIDPTAMPCLWALIRAKKQSMAATAWVIWLDKRVPPVIDPTAMPCLWALIRAKQQSMVATAWVILLCACVRYWPGRGIVNVCPLLMFYVCKIEATVSFISTY